MTAWQEVFAILESNFIRRGTGRIAGGHAPGGNSTEYYLAPGVQYAMRPRFVIEASYQLPLVRNTGPRSAPRRAGLLVGIRLLY